MRGDYISVIIPSYNRKKELGQVLDSYYIQKGVKEVIIIDDCSKQDYVPVIERFREKYKDIKTIYHRNESNKGAGASRNTGLGLASGKWILWGEDDAFLSPDYAQILLKVVNQHERTAAFGSIYYGITPDTPQKERDDLIYVQQHANKALFDYRTFESYFRLKTKKRKVPWGHALILTERSAYNGVRYYEDYKVNGLREETDAQIQLLKKGYSIVYDSDTCCYHFPTRKKGGQHTSGKMKSDFYKIRNNNIFWDRHYEFLKKKYKLKNSKASYKIRLIREILTGNAEAVRRRIALLLE